MTRKLVSELIASAPPVSVSGITVDSRQVERGDLFVALAGATTHGLAYVQQAIERGCAAVLWEFTEGQRAPTLAVPHLGVEGLSDRLSELAGIFYDHPSRVLTVIGVTGTNGKSSCVEFIAQALSRRGLRAGTVGTLGSGVVGEERRPLGLTTPDAATVQRELARLRDAGCTHVAMEVSSHALDQGRAKALRIAVALVTNISRDHLDYHGSMARYIAAKARLLSDFCPIFAVLNVDDDAFGAMTESLCGDTRLMTFGRGRADIQALEIRFDADGSAFLLRAGGRSRPVKTRVLGDFNIANLLAVSAVLLALDGTLPLTELAELLGSLTPPAGRMELISEAGQPTVVIDYAHTPDALAQALAALRSHCGGELYCVFGCGGDRDPGKRPMMGAAAEDGADHVIVTSDNPRSEPAERIIEQVLAGMRDAGQVLSISDRREAIATAVRAAAPEDTILVAGKGHEDHQEIDGQRLPFDDRAVARELLERCA
ncbi:MAG: UDP-N-acetylmuramoyl-L-alanyl-D-glutamate--2,6-diaminopimelate ligase [Pseudomonadota bacterium]